MDARHPNTPEGAKALLKEQSSLDPARIDACTPQPDPEVDGVWLLRDIADEIDGPDALVYIFEDDFETGSLVTR